MRARLERVTTASASKMRSTATDERAAVNRAPASRAAAIVRTSSPARNGSMLLAMNPMATACQSGRAGSGPPSASRSSRRQRIRRMT